MREIKFRYVCKDASGDIFTFVTTIEQLERAKLNINTYGRIESIEGRNLFTGLHDKNGKEIYEGDIVQTLSSWTRKNFYGVVEFTDGHYMLRLNGLTAGLNKELIEKFDYKVVGNIYENPELLKGRTRYEKTKKIR